MIITLQRDLSTPNEMLGRLTAGAKVWDTIERPWVCSNADYPYGDKGQSCVPAGIYKLERHNSEQHPNVWALVNPSLGVYHMPWDVPSTLADVARTTCLIHSANFASELRGCVALGKSRTKNPQGYWGVFNSRDAVNELRTVLGLQLDLQLLILEVKTSG